MGHVQGNTDRHTPEPLSDIGMICACPCMPETRLLHVVKMETHSTAIGSSNSHKDSDVPGNVKWANIGSTGVGEGVGKKFCVSQLVCRWGY